MSLISLSDLLAQKKVLLTDGATGTNFFNMGLKSGYPPEFWSVEAPDKVTGLHQAFIDAGADTILANTFGANAPRLKLHNAQARVSELNEAGAKLACRVAEKADRPIVAGASVGPTGELLKPLGALGYEEAVAVFTEQIQALKQGGVSVIWIETMSAPEEMKAAAQAAHACDMPYVVTASFDTAGKTMMGLPPADMVRLLDDMPASPLAVGANCGVGGSDLLLSILAMSGASSETTLIAKANCGVPEVSGGKVRYTGTPELMADYARLAVDAGARIIGGCCGTTPEHLAAMRLALDSHVKAVRPTPESIVERIGAFINKSPSSPAAPRRRNRRSR